MTIRIGLIASHNATIAESIISSCNNKEIDGHPCVLISNNSNSRARDVANKTFVPFMHISEVTHPNNVEQGIVDVLHHYETDVVCLAGYMKKLGPYVLEEYAGRILNIHPSLLPKFGGQGYYGLQVHQAVIDAGETESGATVHLIDQDYDKGSIVAQMQVPVHKDDTAYQLQKRVAEIEKPLYVQALKMYQRDRSYDARDSGFTRPPFVGNINL